MTTTERTWQEWFTWHTRQTPFQLLHMRQEAENTVKAQDTQADRVSGGKTDAPLPYRVAPADDADLLWVTLILFAREVADITGNPAPRPVRDRMWQGRDEPQGLPVCTAQDVFGWAAEIIRWLDACTHQIAHTDRLGDAPEDLVRVIRDMRRKYPRSEPQFRAYRPRPCPICENRTILPVWGTTGLEAMRCDTCGKMWPSSRYSTTAPPTPIAKAPHESAESPTPSNDGGGTDSP